jgi:hypothetical protein
VTLIKKPLAEYDGLFKKVDARTAKIVESIRDHEATTEAIRQARDDLHKRFMVWDELIAQWQDLPVETGNIAETLVRTTYRLVARHFPQDQDWTRAPGSVESRS